MRRFVPVSILLAAVAFLAACGATYRLAKFRVPAAAPIGNVVAYVGPTGRAAPSGRIWVATPSGQHRRPVTSGVSTGGASPAVSPDGRYVAYIDDGKVRVIPTAGGRPTTIASGDWAIWAPNSRFLVFGSSSRLVVVDVLTGELMTTTSDPPVDEVTWAPTSRFVAFIDGSSRLVVIDVQTGKQMTRGGMSGPAGDSFAFSPNSRRIAYTTGGDLYVVPTSGGSPARLTDDHRSDGVAWGTPGLAFFRYTRADSWGGDIWLTDGRNHDARQLTHGGNDDNDVRRGCEPLYFSANGRELLAQGSAPNSAWVCAVDLASGHVRLIPQLDFALGLSRDGTAVLGASCDSLTPLGTTETIPFTGGKPHILARDVPCGAASWNR